MAKQTGQITVLKNNTVTNVEHQIRFIFTKENGERITRDTTSKGVINFDVPNGDWNVSWFAVDGDQKVLPLRAGLQLKITSSTPATALADWIYGGNTHVADPILTQWITVLDEMKKVRDEFRSETSFVGNTNGKIMREGAGGILSNGAPSVPTGHDMHTKLPNGFYRLPAGLQNSVDWQRSGDSGIVNGWGNGYWSFLIMGSRGDMALISSWNGNVSEANTFYGTLNTAPDKNGVLHTGTGTPKDTLLVGETGWGGNAVLVAGTDNISVGEALGYRSSLYINNAYNTRNQRSVYGIFAKHATTGYESYLSWGHTNPGHMHLQVVTPTQDRTVRILNEANTVVDSNGNYKPASPVIQLHHNRVEYNEDFDKDNPPKFEHLETGVYRITNVREICKDGWTFNKPINGKGQPFFMLKWEQEDETTLIVRVFERTFNSDTGEFGFGEPRDIGVDERWIDFHFEVDHERIAREEAQMQKEQEEYEEQERLRKEAEELAEKEAQEAWEAEMARQEAEMLSEMEE